MLRPAIVAIAVGLAAFVVGLVAEEANIRAVRGSRLELEWLSDALISLTVVGIAYLWLHLKALRMRRLTLEREQIVINEQLRLAAEIQRCHSADRWSPAGARVSSVCERRSADTGWEQDGGRR